MTAQFVISTDVGSGRVNLAEVILAEKWAGGQKHIATRFGREFLHDGLESRFSNQVNLIDVVNNRLAATAAAFLTLVWLVVHPLNRSLKLCINSTQNFILGSIPNNVEGAHKLVIVVYLMHLIFLATSAGAHSYRYFVFDAVGPKAMWLYLDQ